MVGYKTNRGIVPISCDEIFKRIDQTKGPNKAYEVSVSMLEIYNEKVQDLLIPINKRLSPGLKIRESKTLGIFVDGLSKYPVCTYEEIENKMEESYQNRTIGSTEMNATSSRAHTIVTIEFKQINIEGKLKSAKTSVINLVDLAGSERSSSTGATGDRLKEGCNINKSLLILGNVINTLADKAMGKKKDVLPPYRDSALTRILQTALGGNSKTVMICAISPALINFEETLSTLRYADRAKKIQNKAVINESEQDKTVRLLKEENGDLKKMIEDLNKKIGLGGGIIGEEDKEAFIELKEQYEANTNQMSEMQKTFEEKLIEARKIEKENIIGEKVDVNQPHLVVLNEDPQLSHKLKYGLKNLPVYVGRKLGNPTPQICLSGIGIKVNHAVFLYDDIRKGIVIKPKDPDAREYIFVNGKRITGFEGQILKNRDRITFGINSIMLYQVDKNKDDKAIDWEYAQVELQTEMEIFKNKKDEENKKRKAEEMESYRKNLEDKYVKDKIEIEDKMKKQLTDYEDKLKEMNQSVEKSKIENDRKNMEIIMQEKLKLLEQEKVRKKREYEQKEKLEIRKKEEKTRHHEIIHKSEKLEQNLHNVMKKINKMKIIIQELRRNVNLDIYISKDISEHINTLDLSNGKSKANTNILVRVENFEEGTVYYWNLETFQNRYDMMKQIFDKYQDEDFDIWNLSKEDDPLWDEHKPFLLGYAFYKLEPLAFLINNPSTCNIISSNGECNGTITLDIIPHDEDGNEFDDVPDDVNELVGTPIHLKVYIGEANDLPENFCRNTFVEYTSLDDHLTYSSKIVEEKTRNPSFEDTLEHKIDFLTKDDIDFFIKEKVN
jgi:kinesin family protein 13